MMSQTLGRTYPGTVASSTSLIMFPIAVSRNCRDSVALLIFCLA